MKPKTAVIPVFIPHKGCPFDCIYCNQKRISGWESDVDECQVEAVIESCIATMSGRDEIEIAFYGGSFTGIEKEKQIGFLKIAARYVKDYSLNGIRISTRPDYINRDILDYLREYGVKTIELGAQSLDDAVLEKSCRGHNSEEVAKASVLIKEYGFKLGIQTMIGLPGDTEKRDIETARKVIELKPDIVRIYPTVVIRDTILEDMYRKGMYSPLTLEEAVEICARLLDLYRSNNINVIRIGLQATENIRKDADIVAGPFHPAFRHLVESRLVLEKVEEMVASRGMERYSEITIFTGNENISNVIGQKRQNIEYLKKRYRYKAVHVRGDNTLGRGIKIK